MFIVAFATFTSLPRANAEGNYFVRIEHIAYEKSELTAESPQELFEALAARTLETAIRGARFECIEEYKGNVSGEPCQTEAKLFKTNPDFRDYTNHNKYSYMASVELNCEVAEEKLPFLKRKLGATKTAIALRGCL